MAWRRAVSREGWHDRNDAPPGAAAMRFLTSFHSLNTSSTLIWGAPLASALSSLSATVKMATCWLASYYSEDGNVLFCFAPASHSKLPPTMRAQLFIFMGLGTRAQKGSF